MLNRVTNMVAVSSAGEEVRQKLMEVEELRKVEENEADESARHQTKIEESMCHLDPKLKERLWSMFWKHRKWWEQPKRRLGQLRDNGPRPMTKMLRAGTGGSLADHDQNVTDRNWRIAS
eukprot:Platyproteum_vivax@DN9_c0_g1_i1.p1